MKENDRYTTCFLRYWWNQILNVILNALRFAELGWCYGDKKMNNKWSYLQAVDIITVNTEHKQQGTGLI